MPRKTAAGTASEYDKAKYQHNLQTGFLRLPYEIRRVIYVDVLVAPNAIDLWPLKLEREIWSRQKVREQGLDASKLEKERGVFQNVHFGERGWTKFIRKQQQSLYRVHYRLQDDLAYVRREMAVDLLRTCRFVYTEAADIFWGENTFRFGGDVSWEGVRRFLTTIRDGAAIARLTKLEILAPIVGYTMEYQSCFPFNFTQHDMVAINRPEVRFAGYSHRNCDTRPELPRECMGSESLERDRGYIRQCVKELEVNTRYVCKLLINQARSLKNLHLFVPDRWTVAFSTEDHRIATTLFTSNISDYMNVDIAFARNSTILWGYGGYLSSTIDYTAPWVGNKWDVTLRVMAEQIKGSRVKIHSPDGCMLQDEYSIMNAGWISDHRLTKHQQLPVLQAVNADEDFGIKLLFDGSKK